MLISIAAFPAILTRSTGNPPFFTKRTPTGAVGAFAPPVKDEMGFTAAGERSMGPPLVTARVSVSLISADEAPEGEKRYGFSIGR
jgi:hypothetical protein